MNLTVTNPANANQTYIFGSKGAKPTWLLLALAAGTVKVPEGFQDSKDRAKLAAKDKKAERDAAIAALRAKGIIRAAPVKKAKVEVAVSAPVTSEDATQATAEAPAGPQA